MACTEPVAGPRRGWRIVHGGRNPCFRVAVSSSQTPRGAWRVAICAIWAVRGFGGNFAKCHLTDPFKRPQVALDALDEGHADQANPIKTQPRQL